MSNFTDVAEFHRKMGIPKAERPMVLDAEWMLFRSKCMMEEVREFNESIGPAEMADALVDLVYFAMGTAELMGLDWEKHWNEVHAKNMMKIPGQTKRGYKIDAMKPEGWTPPQHEHIIGKNWGFRLAP